jgi:signal peptidase II
VKRATIYGISAVVIAVDQFTKWRATVSLSPDRPVILLPNTFDLTFVTNTGGAFNILPHGAWILVLAALGAIAAIVSYTLRAPQPIPTVLGVALALPLGGAIGNLMDRVRMGHVVDFIHAHMGLHEFPVFNVADSCICVGVGLLALYLWRRPVASEAPAAVKESV